MEVEMEFYASISRAFVCDMLPEGAYLLSAATYWDKDARRFSVPRRIPARRYFIDSGAYSFPCGVPYSWEEYAEFCRQWNPEYVACIDKFRSAAGTVFWLRKNIDAVLLSGFRVVPVVTGKTSAEYAWCFDEIRKTFGVFMPRFVAVGGLKRYARLEEIVGPVVEPGIRIHLFGAAVYQIKRCVRRFGKAIHSSDSSSWNTRFGPKINVFNELMRKHGMSQREVAIRIMLPKYRDAFLAAVSASAGGAG